jgi:hypothetical protein
VSKAKLRPSGCRPQDDLGPAVVAGVEVPISLGRFIQGKAVGYNEGWLGASGTFFTLTSRGPFPL